MLERALYLDQRSQPGVAEDLEKILSSLQDFKSRNPRVFGCLCTRAIATGDMSLGDAESALMSAISSLEVKNE
jgi:hypothetical protein